MSGKSVLQDISGSGRNGMIFLVPDLDRQKILNPNCFSEIEHDTNF